MVAVERDRDRPHVRGIAPRRVPLLAPVDGLERLDGLQRAAGEAKEVSLRGADQQAIGVGARHVARSVAERRHARPSRARRRATAHGPRRSPTSRARSCASAVTVRAVNASTGLERVAAKLPESALGPHENARIHTGHGTPGVHRRILLPARVLVLLQRDAQQLLRRHPVLEPGGCAAVSEVLERVVHRLGRGVEREMPLQRDPDSVRGEKRAIGQRRRGSAQQQRQRGRRGA